MKIKMLFSALLTGILAVNIAMAEDNVHFSGALVAEPCTLPVSDTDIHVDFGTVIVKYLYQYQRTKSQPFTIHLEDCDPSVMKTASFTFVGTADTELMDMLALDDTSSAHGVAIGLEMENGSPLVINKTSPLVQLVQGSNQIKFAAFVQAKPTALVSKNVGQGNFSTVSTFSITYQ